MAHAAPTGTHHVHQQKISGGAKTGLGLDVTRRCDLKLFRPSRKFSINGAGNITVQEFVMWTVCPANTGQLDHSAILVRKVYSDAIKLPSVIELDFRALYSTTEDLRSIHPNIVTAEEYMQDIDEDGQELNLLRTVEKMRAES